MYKVFIENKAVLFISNDNQVPFNRTLKLVNIQNLSFREVRKRRRRISKEILMVVKCVDVKMAWRIFKSGLKLVIAAGGLVENKKGEFLLIYRNRRWDLPKGKLKKEEKKKAGAIREIEEECGVKNLSVKGKLIQTFHVVNQNGEAILKKVFWYKVSCSYEGELVPQLMEGITKVEWNSKKKAAKRFENSWGTIREVIESAKLL